MERAMSSMSIEDSVKRTLKVVEPEDEVRRSVSSVEGSADVSQLLFFRIFG